MHAEEIIRRVPQVRTMLWWALPFGIAMCAFSWWVFTVGFIQEIEGLLQSAPSVQISPATALGPFLSGACAVLVVLLPLRAIPYTGVWSHRLEWLMKVFLAACVPVMLLIVFGSTLIQNHYMPQLGYTRCDLLQGGASLWSNTWIKNSDWCVQGKNREWVNEQEKWPRLSEHQS